MERIDALHPAEYVFFQPISETC